MEPRSSDALGAALPCGSRDGASRACARIGWEADGFSFPYLWATAVATASFASIGVRFSYRVATRVARPGAAVAGTAAVWIASSLPIYQYLLPFGPYGACTLVAAVLVTVWHRHEWSRDRWLVIGLLAGFITNVHPVAARWVLLPAASFLGLDHGSRRERVPAAARFVIGGIFGALPGMVAEGEERAERRRQAPERTHEITDRSSGVLTA